MVSKAFTDKLVGNIGALLLDDKVAIVGIGYSGFSPATPSQSYKELIFDAASRAYAECSVNPRKDVESFVCCEEDLWEGTSITDEYAPDQLGAAQRNICTVSQDGLNGVATAYMHIKSGVASIAVVESHSKLSNVLSQSQVREFALEPYYERPILSDGIPVAAMQMRRFMHDYKVTEEDIAQVVSKNKKNGLFNQRSSYAADVSVEQAMRSPFVWNPLRRIQMAPPADGCVVAVLASAEKARSMTEQPVWIKGIGWNSASTSAESAISSDALYAKEAAKMAYKIAGVNSPKSYFDFAEVDDTYAFKELQHAEALGIADMDVSKGNMPAVAPVPINMSGGSLSLGDLVEATGLVRLLEAVQRLRNAERKRSKGSKRALVQSWRGIPSSSGAVAVLGVE
jgi:acetyl-CoA C-acetyltransferase